jgi:hypothetical protein
VSHAHVCARSFSLSFRGSKIGATINLDPEAKLAARAAIATIEIPRFLSPLNERLLKSPTGFIAGVAGVPGTGAGGLTTGDLQIYGTVNWLRSNTLDGIPTTVVEPYSAILALADKIGALPEVAALEESYKPKPVVA